jgi:hypothetical protein
MQCASAGRIRDFTDARPTSRSHDCAIVLAARIIGWTAPAATAAVISALATGCGGSSSGPAVPTIAPAKTYRLQGFTPAGPVTAGKPTTVGLTILQPSGAAITHYRTGAGPHTGVDLIVVPTDLRALVYHDPPIEKDGGLHQSMVFPEPGRYRVVVDAFPAQQGAPPNLQLYATVTVTGGKRTPTPTFGSSALDEGYRFRILGRPSPKALEPSYLTVAVTDSMGRPARFTPFDGALAHAVFFRERSLDYIHTHICAPNTPACAGTVRGPAGGAIGHGLLRVGVLLPAPGTWRMFLRTKIGGVERATPFTLRAR